MGESPFFFCLSAIYRAVRRTHQNSAKAKKLGGALLPVKAGLVRVD
ncbi:hypothetical protein ACIQXZ_11770 [Bacillus thuringiensis]